MVQFYLLSILLNIVVGVCLFSASSDAEKAFDDFNESPRKKALSKAKNVEETLKNDSIFTNATFCMISGVLCAIVGFIKLFFVFHVGTRDSGLPVLGDFLPALFGLAGGATLILCHFAESFADHELPDFVENILFRYKKYIGCVCIIVAVVHFIIPGFIIF